MHDLAQMLLDMIVVAVGGTLVLIGLAVILITVFGFWAMVIQDYIIEPISIWKRKKSLKVETDERGNKWKEI